MTDNILKLFSKTMEIHKNMRYGQALFNALYILNEELANEIRGTELDPFHNDRRVDMFLNYLEKEWN